PWTKLTYLRRRKKVAFESRLVYGLVAPAISAYGPVRLVEDCSALGPVQLKTAVPPEKLANNLATTFVAKTPLFESNANKRPPEMSKATAPVPLPFTLSVLKESWSIKSGSTAAPLITECTS